MRFRLEAYEGPLDLLLDLIRRHEVDIFDIPIAQITDEYLAYMDAMRVLDLNLSGEWLEMAAMLVFIKSKMLVPRPEVADEDEGPDPRDELVQRLLEYQKYRAAADALDERDILRRDVFTHPSRADEFVGMLGPPPLHGSTLADLVAALRRVVERSKDEGTWSYEVDSQRLVLRAVIVELAEALAQTPRLDFDALFARGEVSRHRIITTFLALLEMTRLRIIRLEQDPDHTDILTVVRAVDDIVERSSAVELEAEAT